MKRLILFVILYFVSFPLFSQIKTTSEVGLAFDYPFFIHKQVSSDIMFSTSSYGINIFLSHNFYFNPLNAFGFSIVPGLTIFYETVELDASKYNLSYNYWDGRFKYIGNFSAYLTYTHLFEFKDNKEYYFVFGAGAVSSFGENIVITYGNVDYDTVLLESNKYNLLPSPSFYLEFGRKIRLNNDNYMNISVLAQYSVKEKYRVEHNFFPNIEAYNSVSYHSTNLSYIGFKIAFEY